MLNGSVSISRPTKFFQIMLRSIENSIKAIGMDNEDMLHLLEQCPVGAESFVARVVHLLTERR